MNRRQLLVSTAAVFVARRVGLAHAAPTDVSLTNLLDDARKKYDLPALAASVVIDDAIVSSAVGVRKLGDRTPVARNDQFHLGSCTKSMTATLCGMVVESGKLRWNQTLAESFPDMAAKMKPEFRGVTLEQLLAHRSGLAANYPPPGRSVADVAAQLSDGTLGKTPREQRRKIVELSVQETPFCEPGTKFVYSNLGYMAAAAMLEATADESWDALIRRRLFQPLGMTTAGFGPMGTVGELDQPRQHRLVGGKLEAVEPFPLADNLPPMGPAGRVHCSAGDWSKYAREHIRGPLGKSKLATATTFKRLHTDPFGDGYGFGWGIVNRGDHGIVLSHSGSNTMNFCTATIYLKAGTSVIVLTNQAGDAAEKACNELRTPLVDAVQQP